MDAVKKTTERYTYGDYCTWDDGLRWELIDGEAFCMSPSPKTSHQILLVALTWQLGNYFQGKDCQVLTAPLDVMLPRGGEAEKEIDTVVQPDVMILCDKAKLQDNGIKGAPDVVFEILSPSTAQRDLLDKLYLYERAGVREYLIVDPDNRTVTAYRRDENRGENPSSLIFSKRAIYRTADVLEFETFEDLKIPMDSIFEKEYFPPASSG
ncbi:MAG: Uma2 family endonuclease [Synergistaceae bacterium]|jgi:Uma2 family endonuclease|nr:Uma2 family endonuclease [Synergistaceae bacterium]